MLYDRYTCSTIPESKLPDRIDLGRFLIDIESSKKEMTYSVFNTNKIINQELLLDKYKNIQDNFRDIGNDVLNSNDNEFNVIPLIRHIKSKLDLNEYEKTLYREVYHLEEIFRQPHYLLEREINKVHVSRAKRVPTKSYEYLASHTEDWAQKSIVKFKPTRVLNEDLQLNYFVYENILAVNLVERSLTYLRSRLKEVHDIKAFLSDYEQLLNNRDDAKGWYKKIRRNLQLIGEVYEDEHYHGKSDIHKLTSTEKTVGDLYKRLLILRNNELYTIIGHTILNDTELRNTNVLVNHKHYRYIRILWQLLNAIKPHKTDEEKSLYEQEIIDGIKWYALSIIAYSLKKYFGYELKGNYHDFTGTHPFYPELKCVKNDKGVVTINICEKTLIFIIIGNTPENTVNTIQTIGDGDSYILYYSDKCQNLGGKLININPLDADSVERVASLLRKYFLSIYLKALTRNYTYKHKLREYTFLFSSYNYLSFDNQRFTFKFINYPQNSMPMNDILKMLISDTRYTKIKNRLEQQQICDDINELVNTINERSHEIIDQHLICFSCGEKLNSWEVFHLNYIICGKCHTLIDASNGDRVICKIDEKYHSESDKNNLGMDYLDFPENML